MAAHYVGAGSLADGGMSAAREPVDPATGGSDDRMLIFGRRHLEHVLADYVVHYNDHRPHRALEQQAPLAGGTSPASIGDPDRARLRRTDKLGGRIHECELAA